MVYIIYHILLIIVSVTIVRTKPCNILEDMSCECHSSSNNETEQLNCENHHKPISTPIQLTNTTLQNPRSFDSFHLTFHAQEFNISATFINQLSYLFPRASPSPSSSSSSLVRGIQQRTIKIILTFQDYRQLHFEDYSFYELFGERPGYTTSLSLELTANGHVTFSPMAFNHLTVDRMSLHSSSLEPYSFEEIFNHTKIGSLSVEGCTPRNNNTLGRYFKGNIRSAKFTKMAELVSSEEFPKYPVSSMIIEAHEPRKMNASTFINYYNLNGVNLVRPKFFFDNKSFDGFQYLENLEAIELDAETIKDNTFQHVNRIRFFTLGQNIRYLSEHSLDHLDYLTRFDVSKVVLDQLYPTSKCVLARYLQKQQKSNPAMIILPPQAEFCDCVYDFILNLINKKPEQSYTDLCQNTQQERCQLSECDVVKNFHVPLKENKIDQYLVPSIDESIIDTPISFYPIDDQTTTTTRATTTIATTTTTIQYQPIQYQPVPYQPIQHQPVHIPQHQPVHIPQHQPVHIPRHPPVYHNSQPDDDNYDPNGSSFADTQVIILQPIQLSSSSPRSYFVGSHASSFKVNKPIDPNAIPTDDNDENIDSPPKIHKSQTLHDINDEFHQIAKKNKTLKWISLSLVGITVFSILLVGTIIWFFTYHSPKTQNKAKFQRVPPASSNV
ncbi:unnamed protein product [Rotaria sordida]|uniref:Uncharacterized protein n=2 Tax=Rotaria sordida TaxID=392033 RepID=A0A814FWW6_9BILA|nr:unnamed protein product [Rotaria sordida]